MRANEFLTEDQQQPVTINIPITITIPSGGGMPQIGTIAAPAGKDLPDEPVMVPPLQQQLELAKQQGGKSSKIINQILSDTGAASDDDGDDDKKKVRENSWNLLEDFDDLTEIFNSTSE
jgi:hypothetical protein